MAKTVRVIPASPKIFRSEVTAEPRRRRTAGYARVSTDHEEQASSYEMQMAHYKTYIESRADWDFVGMYSDEGISGTNTKKRDGFNQMIEDALAGKIDVLRSALIQCNDGVRAVRPLDIWVLARRLSFGSRFFFSEIGDGGVVGCISY